MAFVLLLGAATDMLNWNIATEMRNWNAAKVFSYKEIKSATNNFKEVLGRGSFGSVYLGKLRDGKLVAVKVKFDKSQLGADSFINEVHYLNSSLYIVDS
jgi:predicted Ser/Thr protein kinase